MAELRFVFPPSPTSSVFRKVSGWIASSIAVYLFFTSTIVASAQNSGCSAPTTQKPLSRLDAKPHDHFRYKQKYDIRCIGERGIGKGVNFFSLEREQALGAQMAHDIDTHVQIVRDPETNAYMRDLVQNLAIHSDAEVVFNVKIVKDDEINAYSLPGGFLYVNTGLILDVPDEATLAGLLAHEIAHVAARHGTRALTKRYIVRIATLPARWLGRMALGATDVVVPILMYKFSRDSEREADLLGIEYAYSAGYDPQGFVQFFENLGAPRKQKLPLLVRMFATHPVSKDRIQRAQREIKTLLPAKSEYVVDTSRFDEMRDRLSNLLNGGCQGAGGKPVLLRPGKQCEDSNKAEQPRMRVPLPQPPK